LQRIEKQQYYQHWGCQVLLLLPRLLLVVVILTIQDGVNQHEWQQQQQQHRQLECWYHHTRQTCSLVYTQLLGTSCLVACAFST
jgi:hypothetical protein